MQFRLTFYKTYSQEKFHAQPSDRMEFFGDRNSIWSLWYLLHKEQGYPHVFVHNLQGDKQHPEDGINGMWGYSL